jgi:hypothetical protein
VEVAASVLVEVEAAVLAWAAAVVDLASVGAEVAGLA